MCTVRLQGKLSLTDNVANLFIFNAGSRHSLIDLVVDQRHVAPADIGNADNVM